MKEENQYGHLVQCKLCKETFTHSPHMEWLKGCCNESCYLNNIAKED
jgi:hypothetical protein